MTSEEFKLRLNSLLRRTEPDQVGHWTRQLERPCPDLDTFITDLCFSFLKGRLEPARDYPQLLADDDVVWYFETYIHCQVNAIHTNKDNDALVLALAAIAIIGHESDPRDLTIWIDDVYRGAKSAGVPEPHKYFEQVADWVTNQRVANRMRTYPALFEKYENQKSRGRG